MKTISDYNSNKECMKKITISYMYHDEIILHNEDADAIPNKTDIILIDSQEYSIHRSIYNPVDTDWELILIKA